MCDFGPSVRDFLIHYGGDSYYDLPKLGDGLEEASVGAVSS